MYALQFNISVDNISRGSNILMYFWRVVFVGDHTCLWVWSRHSSKMRPNILEEILVLIILLQTENNSWMKVALTPAYVNLKYRKEGDKLLGQTLILPSRCWRVKHLKSRPWTQGLELQITFYIPDTEISHTGMNIVSCQIPLNYS